MKITIESYDIKATIEIPDDSDIFDVAEAIRAALQATSWPTQVINRILKHRDEL